jgi:hypothetical protein
MNCSGYNPYSNDDTRWPRFAQRKDITFSAKDIEGVWFDAMRLYSDVSVDTHTGLINHYSILAVDSFYPDGAYASKVTGIFGNPGTILTIYKGDTTILHNPPDTLPHTYSKGTWKFSDSLQSVIITFTGIWGKDSIHDDSLIERPILIPHDTIPLDMYDKVWVRAIDTYVKIADL